MKKRYLTYVLIAASITVWGMIAFKVTDRITSSDEPPQAAVHRDPAKAKAEDTLILCYRDPFGFAVAAEIAETEPEDTPMVVIPIDCSGIRFSGVVSGRRRYFLIESGGASLTLLPGDTIPGGFRLEWGSADSVILSKSGQRATVKKI